MVPGDLVIAGKNRQGLYVVGYFERKTWFGRVRLKGYKESFPWAVLAIIRANGNIEPMFCIGCGGVDPLPCGVCAYCHGTPFIHPEL